MKTSVAVLHLVLRSKFRLSGKVQHVIIASTLRLRVSLNIKVTICATRDANIELRDVLFVRRGVGHIFPNLEEPASYEFSSPHCSTPIFGFLPAVCLCCKLFTVFRHNTGDRRWNFSCRSPKTPHLKRKVPSQTPVKWSRFAERRGGIRRCSFHFFRWKLKRERVCFFLFCQKVVSQR